MCSRFFTKQLKVGTNKVQIHCYCTDVNLSTSYVGKNTLFMFAFKSLKDTNCSIGNSLIIDCSCRFLNLSFLNPDVV